MKSNQNSNIYADDKNYKTNFYLRFLSKPIENKYREEALQKRAYSLKSLLTITFCYLIFTFMQSDCFLMEHYCDNTTLLLVSMAAVVAGVCSVQYKISHYVTRACLLPLLVYQYIAFLDQHTYDTGLILMTLYTALTSFLVNAVWFQQLLYNGLAYFAFFAYIRMTSSQHLLRKSYLDSIWDLTLYNVFVMMVAAFVEKDDKEKWVLLDTFKKSERIFRKVYEDLPYAMFTVNKNNRILYSNRQGIILLSNYVNGCNSCDFSKKSVLLDNMIDEKYIAELDKTREKVGASREPESCFVSLRIPEEVPSGDLKTCVGKWNYYKVIVEPVLWKKEFAYTITLREYSAKKKSEIINAQAIGGLVNDVEEVIKSVEVHEAQNNEDSSQSKVELLAQANQLKLSVLNTKVLFNHIFDKKENLKGEHNFNIQKVVLASIATMSSVMKENNCSVDLKFEPSFPSAVSGDEHLFEQIFFNALAMLIKCYNGSKIIVDCKLESYRNGAFLLSFEFQTNKKDQATFELLQTHMNAINRPKLDHFITNDNILYKLALIKPGIDVFNGTSELEENQNGTYLDIKLHVKGEDSMKPYSSLLFPSLESCHYISSSRAGASIYSWNADELKKRSSARERFSSEGKITVSIKPPLIQLPTATSIETNSTKPHTRSQSMDHNTTLELLKRGAKNKFIESLRRLKKEGAKNFGSLTPEIKVSQSASATLVEPEKGDSADTVKIVEKDSGFLTPNKDLGIFSKYRAIRESSKITLSETDEVKGSSSEEDQDDEPKSAEDMVELYKKDDRELKTALAKALMGLIDEYKTIRRFDGDGSPSVGKVTSTLEIVTLQDRMEHNGVDEQKLYSKTLEHLGTKFKDDSYRERFGDFLDKYIQNLHKDIKELEDPPEPPNLFELTTFYPNVENSPPTLMNMKRAFTTKTNELRNAIQLLRNNSNSSISMDSERSKKRTLSGRLLLSPSMNTLSKFYCNPNKRRGSLEEPNPCDKPGRPASPTRGKRSPKKTFDFDKPFEQPKDVIIPFKAEKIPKGIQARTETQSRKWISLGTTVNSTASKSFTYYDTFTILVVDDSNFVFQALSSLPTRYRILLEYANNGTDGLKKYLYSLEQGKLYHFILMDLQMPVMDGFETVRNIREEESKKGYPETYICAMSAFNESEAAARAKREGMNNYCQKPLRVEVLNNLIKMRAEETGIDQSDLERDK